MRAPCAAAAIVAIVSIAGNASAHIGGALPVETTFEAPTWLVWSAGAGVVAFSFVVMGAFATRPGRQRTHSSGPEWPHRVPTWAVRGGRFLGSLVLATIVVAAAVPGYGGILPPTVVWLVVWSGLAALSYLVGNAWELVNPFRVLAPLSDTLRGRRPPTPYPARLGVWPATVVLLALIGLEVRSGASQDAVLMARLVAGYSLATVVGMSVFGARTWLARAEVFTVAFRHWSAMAPLQPRRGGLVARSPATGLQDLDRSPGSATFIVALLYGVNFDGFLSTSAGRAALEALAPLGPSLAHVGVLLGGFAAFLAAFRGCMVLVQRTAATLQPVGVVGACLAPALVPIAAGYHLAHNAFYLMENAPLVLAALVDPLGLGWGAVILGAASTSWTLPAAVVAAAPAVQISLIVAGHVLAVVVGHRLAGRTFPSRVQAVRSEWPLTAVMVLYTFVGLWIVGQGHIPGVTG